MLGADLGNYQLQAQLPTEPPGRRQAPEQAPMHATKSFVPRRRPTAPDLQRCQKPDWLHMYLKGDCGVQVDLYTPGTNWWNMHVFLSF